jgi:hypothetical protein
MSLLDTIVTYLFRREQHENYVRALAHERKHRPRPRSRASAMDAARRGLAAGDALTFGTLPDGAALRVARPIAFMSALIVGASGSGKTRLLVALLLDLLGEWLRQLNTRPSTPLGFHFELSDPKFETYDLLRKHLAALWMTSSDRTRERLVAAVRVIDWSRTHVTPFAPFDNPRESRLSNAYLAHLRTDVMEQSSRATYTEPMRQLLFMFHWLMVELRFPPNYRFAVRFMHDETFRRSILARVPEPDVRYFFENFDVTTARATRDGVLRRIQGDQAFPEVRFSIGIPPAALERLAIVRSAPFTLGNYACTMTLPLSKGLERAAWRLTDLLIDAPRRDTSVPMWIGQEEAIIQFLGSPDLAEAFMAALRTLRSVRTGIVLLGQDVANALPAHVLRNILLNTRWIAGFQCREEAQIFYPHVVFDADDLRSEGDRQRDFQREMEGLARQHFQLLVKGHAALPLRAPTVPDPTTVAGIRDEAELLEVFGREFAPRSMVAVSRAAELIAEWERDVVDHLDVPMPAPRAAAAAPIRSLADLKKYFSAEEDDDV